MSRKLKGKKNYKMYNQTLYEVERVVQIKWMKNRQFCFIKWKGYDQKFNTWEPKDHITFCYNYLAPQEKDDDPQYVQNIAVPSAANHHYQTRAKNKPAVQPSKTPDSQQKEDRTQLEDQQVENNNIFPLQKSNNQVSSEEVEIKKKGESDQAWVVTKDKLVVKILNLPEDKTKQQRMGKVQLENGKIGYIMGDILKSRYPSKVIEYYEDKLRKFSSRND